MVVTARIAAFTDMIPLYSPVCIFVVIPEQQIVSWAIASFFRHMVCSKSMLTSYLFLAEVKNLYDRKLAQILTGYCILQKMSLKSKINNTSLKQLIFNDYTE